MSHPYFPQSRMMYRDRRAPAPTSSYLGSLDSARGSYDISEWASPGYVRSEPDGFSGFGETGLSTCADQLADTLARMAGDKASSLGVPGFLCNQLRSQVKLEIQTAVTIISTLSASALRAGARQPLVDAVARITAWLPDGISTFLSGGMGWLVDEGVKWLEQCAATQAVPPDSVLNVAKCAGQCGSQGKAYASHTDQPYSCQCSGGVSTMKVVSIDPNALKQSAYDIQVRGYKAAAPVAPATKSGAGLAVGVAAAAGLALLFLKGR